MDHSVLLNKLKQLNINTSLWLWIQSYLTDRTQQVKLPGALSTKRFRPAGVLQGSVISPLLFNVFIDDIDDAIPVNLRDRVRVCKYTDDCTFYESISTNDESSMQVVLNSIHEWTTSNLMLMDQFSFLDNRVRIQETEYESLLVYESHSSLIAITAIELGYDKSCWI